jgi:hypothetical protein
VLAIKAGYQQGSAIASGLGDSPMGALELGYAPAFGRERLQLLIELAFARPSIQGAQPAQGRSPAYHWTVISRQFSATTAVLARVRPLGSPWNLYGLGGVAWLLQDSVGVDRLDASGDTTSATEVSVHLGLRVAAGIEVAIGPGCLLGEAGYATAAVNQKTTGSARAGGPQGLVGYRLSF